MRVLQFPSRVTWVFFQIEAVKSWGTKRAGGSWQQRPDGPGSEPEVQKDGRGLQRLGEPPNRPGAVVMGGGGQPQKRPAPGGRETPAGGRPGVPEVGGERRGASPEGGRGGRPGAAAGSRPRGRGAARPSARTQPGKGRAASPEGTSEAPAGRGPGSPGRRGAASAAVTAAQAAIRAARPRGLRARRRPGRQGPGPLSSPPALPRARGPARRYLVAVEPHQLLHPPVWGGEDVHFFREGRHRRCLSLRLSSRGRRLSIDTLAAGQRRRAPLRMRPPRRRARPGCPTGREAGARGPPPCGPRGPRDSARGGGSRFHLPPSLFIP